MVFVALPDSDWFERLKLMLSALMWAEPDLADISRVLRLSILGSGRVWTCTSLVSFKVNSLSVVIWFWLSLRLDACFWQSA